MSFLTKFRIPTILGLAIIVLGTATGVYLTLQNQNPNTQAQSDNTPQNIKVANITDSSVTITWQTPTKINSFVQFSQNNVSQTIIDDRDQKPNPRSLHLATLKNLTPSSNYKFKIIAGKFSSEGEFTTAPVTETQNNFQPVIGSVLDGDKPLDNGLVFLNLPGASLQVAPIKSLGNFVIPLTTMRTEDLSTIFSSITTGKLEVRAENDGKASATVDINNPNLTKPLKIGQDLDLTKAPESLGVKVNKFDLNSDGEVNTSDYGLVNKSLNKKPVDKKADLNSDNRVDKKDLDLISAEIKKNSK